MKSDREWYQNNLSKTHMDRKLSNTVNWGYCFFDSKSQKKGWSSLSRYKICDSYILLWSSSSLSPACTSVLSASSLKHSMQTKVSASSLKNRYQKQNKHFFLRGKGAPVVVIQTAPKPIRQLRSPSVPLHQWRNIFHSLLELHAFSASLWSPVL